MTQLPPPQPPSAHGQQHRSATTTWPQGQSGQAPGTSWPQDGAPSQRGRRSNPFAIAALVVAALLVLTGPARQVAFQIGILESQGAAAIGAIGSVFTALTVVLALVSLALGIVGLVVRERGRLLAAAAVGIGAANLVGTILSLVTGFALTLA